MNKASSKDMPYTVVHLAAILYTTVKAFQITSIKKVYSTSPRQDFPFAVCQMISAAAVLKLFSSALTDAR
jgi:hypothetical protein